FRNQSGGVVLPLRFVEDDPRDDGRMIPVIRNQADEFGFKLRNVQRLRIAGVRIGAGHVLPDKDAQLVRPIIPAVEFNLDMRATALTVIPFVAPKTIAVTLRRLLSMSGTSLSAAMFVVGTGSSHTGCQMPLHDVYMIPPG